MKRTNMKKVVIAGLLLVMLGLVGCDTVGYYIHDDHDRYHHHRPDDRYRDRDPYHHYPPPPPPPGGYHR